MSDLYDTISDRPLGASSDLIIAFECAVRSGVWMGSVFIDDPYDDAWSSWGGPLGAAGYFAAQALEAIEEHLAFTDEDLAAAADDLAMSSSELDCDEHASADELFTCCMRAGIRMLAARSEGELVPLRVVAHASARRYLCHLLLKNEQYTTRQPPVAVHAG